MAYSASYGLIQVQKKADSTWVTIPLKYIRFETYQINPMQSIDLDSYRSETGTLIRNVIGAKAKIEFNTPIIPESDWTSLWTVISAGFNNNDERKLKLRYYDTWSSSYKTGWFYVPDVSTPIRNIDPTNNNILYNEIRVAFIEY